MKLSSTRISAKTSASFANTKKYWNIPHEGEFLSNKQFIFFCLGSMGIEVFGVGSGLVSWGANWFAGNLMGIAVKDFVTIGIIGTVLGYVLIFMSPLGMLIYENHGKLNKKERTLMHSVTLAKIIIGFILYFVPSVPFESIIRGFPQLLGNMLFLGGLLDYVNWFIRYKFCARYGRIKPFIIVAAIPAVALLSIIPFLPLQGLDYSTKIVILHGAFTVSGWFAGSYNNTGSMVNFMTQNTQERQRLISFSPLLRGLLTSLIGIVLPILITKTSLVGHKFGGYEDIMVYKFFGPLFAVLSLVGVLFFLPVRENLIEQKIDRPEVHFFRGAKQVLQNKYLWIVNISNLLGGISGMTGSLVTWWMMYDQRQQWAMGLVMNFIYIGGTLGNIMTPSVTKRFDKRNIYVWGRVINASFVFVFFALFKLNMMWPYVAFMFLSSIFSNVVNGIGGGLTADSLDYYQWKNGERCDSISGVFGWFTSPVAMAIGYIAPFVYQRVGYTSDWGVLYDSVVFNRLFTYSFYITFVGTILSVIPYFFYDLTAAKHRKCVDDIRERTRRADISEIEKHRELGTISMISPQLLERYGFDSEGYPIEEAIGEVLV
ncbi:MAG: MFS transporter [Eubacteriales bacterium]